METRGNHVIKGQFRADGNAKFSKGADIPYLEILDVKTNGTAGGTFSAEAWRTRDLTVVIFDDFAVSISLAASPGDGGDFTLPAGVYYTEIECPAFNVNEHVARLADVTDDPGQYGATVIMGTSEFSADTALWRDSTGANGIMTIASSGQTRSKIAGKFQLRRQSKLEIQHRCANTQIVDGFGSDNGFYITSNFYIDNVFTTLRMWRVRDDS